MPPAKIYNRMEPSCSTEEEKFVMPPNSSIHSLLEDPAPAYSDLTIKRAYIVWWHTGQRNQLKAVCNYYHNLEILEGTMSVEHRTVSRMRELNLISNHPPKSEFLMEYFPNLYRHSNNINNKFNRKVNMREVQTVLQEVSQKEECVFTLEGFRTLKIQKGAKLKDIFITSHMIRLYCKSHKKSLIVLLAEFEDFIKKTRAEKSVDNMAMYITKQYLKDEFILVSNMAKNFSLLDSDELDDVEEVRSRTDSGVESEVVENNSVPSSTDAHTVNQNIDDIQTIAVNGNINENNINESRNQELFSIVHTNSENEATDIEEEKSECIVYEQVHNCNG